MGWSLDWASTAGSDFNRDLGFTSTEEELKPFLEAEIPPVVTQMAVPAEEISAETARAELAEATAQVATDEKSQEDRTRRLNRARAMQEMAKK